MQLFKADPRSGQSFAVKTHLICHALHAGPVDISRRRRRRQADHHAPGPVVHVRGGCPLKVRQHDQPARLISPAVGILHAVISLIFAEGLQAPLDQRAARIGVGIGDILAGQHIGHHGIASLPHDSHVRERIIDRGQALRCPRPVGSDRSVECACSDRCSHLVMADGDDHTVPVKAGLLRRLRRHLPGRGACRHRLAHHSRIDPGFLKDLPAPGERMNVKSHRAARQRVIDLRPAAQLPDDIILDQMDPPRHRVHLRPVALDPHKLGDRVHLMRILSRDLSDLLLSEAPDQLAALHGSPRISVKHGIIQGLPCLIRHDKSFPKTRHANSRNIRMLRGHLPYHCPDTLHQRPDIRLMPACRPAHRVIPVRPAKPPALFIKHRQLTAGSPDVQTCNLHDFPLRGLTLFAR